MKSVLVGMLLASVIILPAEADNNSRHQGNSGGSTGSGGGTGTGAAPAANSSSTATGGAGGAGGNGTGGSATGGSATGGNATGGAATGGKSSANGNSSTVTVSVSGSGTSAGTAADPSAATTVRYDGSYTVKSAPPIAAPSLTSTFSDTCMGSSSFGLSFVGFGATGGTTMVDEACVRRLDSREFRAMGLNDVALALLCQSAANRKAVEATGRACPSATPANDTASAAKPAPALAMVQPKQEPAPVETQPAMSLAPETPLPATASQAPQAPQAADVPQQAASAATPEPVPAQARVEATEIAPVADDAGGK